MSSLNSSTPSTTTAIPVPLPNYPKPVHITKYQTHDIQTTPSILSHPLVGPYLVAPPYPYTLFDAESWVNSQMKAGPDSDTIPLQVIREGDVESGRLMGSISLTKFKRKGHADEEWFEIGYFLDPQYHGRGIMRAAATALLNWARDEGGVKNVIIRVAVMNSASQSVVAGLIKEGWQFEVCEEEAGFIDWPENRGGGRKLNIAWVLKL